jgi:HK97 family phage major capsid protein
MRLLPRLPSSIGIERGKPTAIRRLGPKEGNMQTWQETAQRTAEKKLIVARKKFEALQETLRTAFKQAGPERDLTKITVLRGDEDFKAQELLRLSEELAISDAECKVLARETVPKGNADMNSFSYPDDSARAAALKAANGAGFRNLGDFIMAVRDRPGDLKAMGIDSGEGGGFAVPDAFSQRILTVSPMDAIIRPRAQVFPPGQFPDAKLEIPALRQGLSGIAGGINFAAANEGTAGAADDPKLDLITLEPQRISGYVTVGNSLLRNDTAMSGYIETLFRNSKAAWEDNQFIQGSGGAYPLGLLNAPGALAVIRNTAASIVFTDIGNMIAKQISNNPIWICTKSAIQKIIGMADALGNSIWIAGDLSKGLPPTLAGFPIYFTFRQPALGTKGDLMLVDPSYYLIKDGSGPFIQASEHVNFTLDQTIVKATFFLDAEPWVRSPIVLDDGTSQASPYVILQ